jgi:hypothetical protein
MRRRHGRWHRRCQRVGDRKARMGIHLCQREARTCENGPPHPCGRNGPQPGSRASEHARGPRWRHCRHGPAAAHTQPPRTRRVDRQNRSSPHRRPTPPSASSPDPRSCPPTPVSLCVASMVPHRSHNTHQPTHHTPPVPPCRRPAPGPPAPAWAGPPRFTWRVEEGGQRNAVAPLVGDDGQVEKLAD